MLRLTKDGCEYEIREAQASEWDHAMNLAFKVFLKYEAPEYGKQGTDEFARFVTDPMLKKMFLAGNYKLFVAVSEDGIIGIISLRGGNHISLLFVEPGYHMKGIGSALIEYAVDYLSKESLYSSMTVNSSPYATEFYHTLGFEDTGVQMRADGIIYTPMRIEFSV